MMNNFDKLVGIKMCSFGDGFFSAQVKNLGDCSNADGMYNTRSVFSEMII